MDLTCIFSVRGMPRYLEGKELSLNSIILAIFYWMGGEVLRKNSLDLSMFMVVLEALENSIKLDLKANDSLIVGVPMSKVSSMNC